MSTQPAPGKLSFAEYLEREARADYRSEYRGGEMVAMAGGSDDHAALCGQIVALVWSAVKTRCRVYSSDLKIYAATVNEAMYPDVTIGCGDREYYEGRTDVVLNPTVVVEVLSPSTRQYDLSLKADFSRTIASVQTLLYVDSEQRYVQSQTRQQGNWRLEVFTKPEDVIWSFEGRTLTLGEIYDGILPAEI